MTTIELTNKEAELFKEFQKYHFIFEALKYAQAFEMKNGSVTLNFNYLGQLKSINKIENYNQ